MSIFWTNYQRLFIFCKILDKSIVFHQSMNMQWIPVHFLEKTEQPVPSVDLMDDIDFVCYG